MVKHFVCLFFAFFLLLHDILLLEVVAQSGITQTAATLSETRYWLAATSSGELVFFGGGWNATGPSDRVDICNVSSGIWTTATLSIPRYFLAAASSEKLVFFAGGGTNSQADGYVQAPTVFYNQVDIYNISAGSWANASLSQARCRLAATSVGSLVLFGGGYNGYSSDVVDIYNVTSNTWINATLSQARNILAAITVDNRYALFAGGCCPINAVDIYDSLTGTWNATTISQGAAIPAAASLGNLAFIGGGDAVNASRPFNTVNIFNATSQTWSTATLSQNRTWLAAASIEDIVAFGGGTSDGSLTFSTVVDIYNVSSNIWFTINLRQPRGSLAATSSTKKIFFGGGGVNSNGLASNTIDIFDISPLLPPIPSNLGMSSTSEVSSTSPNNVLIGGLIGAIGGVLMIGTGVFLVIFLLFKRIKHKHTQLANLNTTISRSEITTKHSSQSGATNQTQLLETSRKFAKYSQISLSEITIEKELGEGSHGRVYLGKWHAGRVALKFCKNNAKLEKFMNEIKLMVELPPHPNVVQVFGVSLDGPQPVIVMEYCAGGSLDTLLFGDNVKLSDEQKIRFVRGIALGMKHLHEHNIVHRDLAARNILLTGSGDSKISDFGMSRIVARMGEGRTKSDIGPVSWMAPESLAKRIYSKKSDVWSFGIVVYEIVAQCEPHKDRVTIEVALEIRDRHLTPNIPSNCPPILREVMQLCWQADSSQRPVFLRHFFTKFKR